MDSTKNEAHVKHKKAVRNMTQRPAVYAVVALAMGYLLMSTVPGLIEPPRMGDAQKLAKPGEGFNLDTSGERAGESSVSAGGGSQRDWGIMIGLMLIDVGIALGVYIIARQRLF